MDTIVKKTRTRLSPEKRKQQLLDFALEVFARRGIGRAGHADIAEMANVSVATVFNYFPTREALVEQVLAQVENRFSILIAECLGNQNKPLYPRLTYITHSLIDTVIEQQDWLKVWFEWSTSVRNEIWPQFINGNKQSHQRLADMFAQGIENQELDAQQSPDELAWQLHGICYVLYLQANINPDQDKMREQAAVYISALLSK
ncbi:TetR/AcrR family transcriptional regulator [Photobacterium chitinilyticum]|uniref:TetR/AcrR family transcriptional regulator n=1 Tax=Photobacterium chitinilyticum TaxID=2485123 RepID=A0A444JLG5_9GAMM|nr:TetR/AcrR family transcriptional regulator [Photobacterium chitinilyticum]RWX53936.1 TetR/AcrR family transcriptional regulator [Photobacterium chitinilyticum]